MVPSRNELLAGWQGVAFGTVVRHYLPVSPVPYRLNSKNNATSAQMRTLQCRYQYFLLPFLAR